MCAEISWMLQIWYILCGQRVTACMVLPLLVRKSKGVSTSGAASKEPAGDVQVVVEDGASGDRDATVKIYATGICCPSEVPLITRILAPLPGVSKVRSLQLLRCIAEMFWRMLFQVDVLPGGCSCHHKDHQRCICPKHNLSRQAGGCAQ